MVIGRSAGPLEAAASAHQRIEERGLAGEDLCLVPRIANGDRHLLHVSSAGRGAGVGCTMMMYVKTQYFTPSGPAICWIALVACRRRGRGRESCSTAG